MSWAKNDGGVLWKKKGGSRGSVLPILTYGPLTNLIPKTSSYISFNGPVWRAPPCPARARDPTRFRGDPGVTPRESKTNNANEAICGRNSL